MSSTTRTRRPARTYRVTRVELANTATGETFSVPGMIVTLAELRAMIACAPSTVQVWCETCGESVADCSETARLVDCPASWSAFQGDEEDDDAKDANEDWDLRG